MTLNNNVIEQQQLFVAIVKEDNLRKAWKHIYSKSRQSSSSEIREEAFNFQADNHKHIKTISEELKSSSFNFNGSRGTLLKKSDGSSRPILIPPIKIRIVQRAILQILDELPCFEKYFNNEYSFGGIENGGTVKAINRLDMLLKSGNTYFYKCDIKSFFDNIQFEYAEKLFIKHGIESKLIDLIKQITLLEIDNIDSYQLKPYTNNFDYSTKGIPQGSCLSPFIANILLHEFDRKMNDNDFNCVRYIDDFILLTTTQQISQKQFSIAKKILNTMHLSLKEDKSRERGNAKKLKFDFLGIEIDFPKKLIRPTNKNIKKLYDNISTILTNKQNYDLPVTTIDKFALINKKIIGWGNTFRSTCNDFECYKLIDNKICRLILKQMSKKFSIKFPQKITEIKDKQEYMQKYFGIKNTADKYTISFIKNDRDTRYLRSGQVYIVPINKRIKYKLRNQAGNIKEEYVNYNGNQFNLKEQFLNTLENDEDNSLIQKFIGYNIGIEKVIKTIEDTVEFKKALTQALRAM